MSQASDLLNSLTDEQIATYSAGSGETEPHIVIGDDRYIQVPESLKKVAVQFDHDIETVTFDCPRYWDGIDMSEMAIYINYIRSDKYGDKYPAKNVTVEDDVMHFEWTISRNVTAVKGQLAFLVCIKKTDAEGNEVNHWNSEICTDMYISEGMETEEQALEMQPDLVTELLLRMASVEKINIQADAMAEIHNETMELKEEATTAAIRAEDALSEIEDKDDYIRNSYANAVKGKVSGEIIRVDDVSPIEHTVKAKVGGKNRFNIASYHTETDYSNNQTIYAISAENLVIGKTYTVSSSVPMQWFKISNSATGYSCVGLSDDKTGFTSYTFTHNRNINIREDSPLYIYINNLDKTAMYDLSIMETMEISIVEGSVPATYEPFVDPTTITVTACGRNIFKPGKVADYDHVGDMTISAGGDISATVTSSNSSHAVNVNRKYPPGTYAIAFIYSDSAPRTLIRVYDKSGVELSDCASLENIGFQYNSAYKGFFKNGSAHTITIPEDVAYWCMGFVFPVTSTALVGSTTKISYAQVQYAVDVSDFEVYNGAEYTPATDGTVEITSINPIMSVFTNTPDATVDIEYNRDTTKMFESYVLTDKAKSEIVDEIEYDLDKQYGNIESALDEIIEIQEDLLVPNGDEVSY